MQLWLNLMLFFINTFGKKSSIISLKKFFTYVVGRTDVKRWVKPGNPPLTIMSPILFIKTFISGFIN